MRKPLAVHPFFFAMFHVLFLLEHNLKDTPVKAVFIPLAAALLFTLLLTVAADAFFRNRIKSGLLASLLVVSFFSYGQLLNPIKAWRIFGFMGPHDLLCLGFLVLIGLCAAALARTGSNLKTLTKFAHALSMVLVLISLIRISAFFISSGRNRPLLLGFPEKELAHAQAADRKGLPDIYYIVLDSYARQDVLRDMYGYDNSGFIKGLEQRGFFVGKKSSTNYFETIFSLNASMNMHYMEDIIRVKNRNSADLVPLQETLKNNLLFRVLKRYGYKTVATETGYFFTNMTRADRFLTVHRWQSDEFTAMLVNTTFLSFVFKQKSARYNPLVLHEKRIESALRHLADPPRMPGPFLFFAHIMSPHPYVAVRKAGVSWFQLADGTYYFNYTHETMEQYRTAYIGHVESINGRILRVIDAILAKKDRPSIMVIQGDHGPGSHWDWDEPEKSDMRERFGILNAVYIPGGNGRYPGDAATPVNTFRIILNQTLGARFEILEDKNYYSAWHLPYQFIEWKGDAGAVSAGAGR